MRIKCHVGLGAVLLVAGIGLGSGMAQRHTWPMVVPSAVAMVGMAGAWVGAVASLRGFGKSLRIHPLSARAQRRWRWAAMVWIQIVFYGLSFVVLPGVWRESWRQAARNRLVDSRVLAQLVPAGESKAPAWEHSFTFGVHRIATNRGTKFEITRITEPFELGWLAELARRVDRDPAYPPALAAYYRRYAAALRAAWIDRFQEPAWGWFARRATTATGPATRFDPPPELRAAHARLVAAQVAEARRDLDPSVPDAFAPVYRLWIHLDAAPAPGVAPPIPSVDGLIAEAYAEHWRRVDRWLDPLLSILLAAYAAWALWRRGRGRGGEERAHGAQPARPRGE